LLRKAELGSALRWAWRAATAGAAWLGLGLIVADDDPTALLGLIAAVLALAGGWAARPDAKPPVLRLLVCLGLVVAARMVAGPLAAVLATACLAAGWWLHIRPRDVVLVLAFFGAVVAAVSGASWELGLAFLALGLLTAGIRPALALARRGLRLLGILRRERRGPLEGAPETLQGRVAPESP
jgi:hypothetical protein